MLWLVPLENMIDVSTSSRTDLDNGLCRWRDCTESKKLLRDHRRAPLFTPQALDVITHAETSLLSGGNSFTCGNVVFANSRRAWSQSPQHNGRQEVAN